MGFINSNFERPHIFDFFHIFTTTLLSEIWASYIRNDVITVLGRYWTKFNKERFPFVLKIIGKTNHDLFFSLLGGKKYNITLGNQ